MLLIRMINERFNLLFSPRFCLVVKLDIFGGKTIVQADNSMGHATKSQRRQKKRIATCEKLIAIEISPLEYKFQQGASFPFPRDLQIPTFGMKRNEFLITAIWTLFEYKKIVDVIFLL